MNSRLIRVLIVIIGIAIASSAVYLLYDLDTQISSHRSSIDTLHEQASALKASIGDVRSGQFAYVARGQNEPFWMSRVAALMPALEQQTVEFSAGLMSPDAQKAFEGASAALENVRALDTRVRDFVKGGTSLLAADLIFSDGLEATTAASTQVQAALNEELQARNNEMAALAGRRTMVVGGSAVALLLLLIALALTGTVPAISAEPAVAAPPPLDPVRFETPLPKAKPAVTPKLVTTAQLCGELARVADEAQLPHLLQRAARVLDAAGIIVWMFEPSRQCLRPAMSHGYDEKTIFRMGNIHRDANNAAAAAFRSSEVRTVGGDGTANGAVIVSLMTSGGCVGVLSAEMKGGSEKDESSQALATIFAAQLATLVATPESSDPADATEAPPAATPLKSAAQA